MFESVLKINWNRAYYEQQQMLDIIILKHLPYISYSNNYSTINRDMVSSVYYCRYYTLTRI
jgi:hypothetical protein